LTEILMMSGTGVSGVPTMLVACSQVASVKVVCEGESVVLA